MKDKTLASLFKVQMTLTQHISEKMKELRKVNREIQTRSQDLESSHLSSTRSDREEYQRVLNGNKVEKKFLREWLPPLFPQDEIDRPQILLSKYAWELFPRLSDKRLGGKQTAALSRIFKLFKLVHIVTVADLVRRTEQEIGKYRDVGEATVTLIKKYLEVQELRLGMKFDEKNFVHREYPRVTDEVVKLFPPAEENNHIALMKTDVPTLYELQTLSELDLRNLGMSPQVAHEISNLMLSYGLQLRSH